MMTYQDTFTLTATLGGFTNESFGGSTRNAGLIRQLIALGMKQIVALAGNLSYNKTATITLIDGQQFYPLPADCATVASVVGTSGTLQTPLDKTDESEWARINSVSVKSNLASNYRVKNRTGLASQEIGVFPIPSGGTTITVDYISSMQELNFAVGTGDGGVLLPLEEGYEMLPIYYALSMILKGREENGVGNDWGTEYSDLLGAYKTAGMNQTKSLVVKKKSSSSTVNPNHFIHITG